MIEYFKKEYLEQAQNQRKKTLIVYFMVLALYVALSVVVLIRYTQLPYMSEKIVAIKAVEYVITFFMLVFSFLYLGIKYKRVNKYYHLLKNLQIGLREEFVASFFEYDENLSTKDGVDVKALVFLEWNKFKKDYFDRKVWVLYELPFPEIPEKATVKFVTQGNVLVSYEILSEEE